MPNARHSAMTLAALLLISLAGLAGAHAAETISVGHDPQVFVDDFAVQSMRGLVRRINVLAKHHSNPVLKPDHPWEENFALPISCFYDRDEKLYRMWYRPAGHKFNLAYATSRDGLTWDKPILRQYSYKGSKENSQLSVYTGPAWGGVIKDVRDPDPQRLYKLLSYNQATRSNSLYLFVSPDGLTWKPHSDKPLLEGLADCHTLQGWDPKINRYVAYVRPDKAIRTIARTTSEDMVNWSEFQTVLEPDEDDPPGTQFYGMSSFPDHGVYYGLLWVYHPNQLMIDVQLTFSRDGEHWQRAGRRHPILMYGLPDQFDSHLLIAMQPILMGDEVKVFYLGYNQPHAVVYPNEAYPPLPATPPRKDQPWLATRVGCGGLATCLRDRFVSLTAGAEDGELITKPFKIDGSQIRLNADGKRGSIMAELIAADGKPIPGFTAAESIPLRDDGVAIPVRWKGDKSLSALQGQTVQLRVLMKNARLFAFEVAK